MQRNKGKFTQSQHQFPYVSSFISFTRCVRAAAAAAAAATAAVPRAARNHLNVRPFHPVAVF